MNQNQQEDARLQALTQSLHGQIQEMQQRSHDESVLFYESLRANAPPCLRQITNRICDIRTVRRGPYPSSMNPSNHATINGRSVPFILDPTSHPIIEAMEFIMWWRRENSDAAPTEDARLGCLRSAATTMRQHPMYSRDAFIRSVQEHFNHWKWEVGRSDRLVHH
jgi:hypothetical protein